MLDNACLFQILVELPYVDLQNIIWVRPYLKKITNTPYFKEEWKKLHLSMAVDRPPENFYNRVETDFDIDTLKTHGTVTRYNGDGSIYDQAEYIQGVEHGKSKYYSADILRCEIDYVDGLPSGHETRYDDKGDVCSYTTSTYRGRTKHGLSKIYHVDGKINWEEYYDGACRGRYISWHANGNLSNMQTCGVDGSFTDYCWFKNGQKLKEEPHVNGKLHGVRRMWNEFGELILEQTYENGHIVRDYN
jgi:antitoxin component YwqK of YwqJK toxin-antitoxin module